MELKGKRINFLGDSITEGAGTSNMSECRFITLIEKREGVIVRNYGIGGTRIAWYLDENGNQADSSDYCTRALLMDPNADVVVVFGGTNDFGHGNSPLGNMSDRTPNTFYGAMHTLCKELLERYPESEIVFITPTHRANEELDKGDGCKAEGSPTLKEYVNIIREVCEYYSLPVLDLFKCSRMQPEIQKNKEKYMPDGLHPNDAGHKILADRIISFLKAL